MIAVQGRRARDLLASLVEGIAMAEADFPHMAVRTGRLCGLPTRLFRISFTGEPGFEVNVPAGHAAAVWQALLAAAQALGGCAYGSDDGG